MTGQDSDGHDGRSKYLSLGQKSPMIAQSAEDIHLIANSCMVLWRSFSI
jgi:hypothetical protein